MPIVTTDYTPVSRFSFLSDYAKGRRQLWMLGITNQNLSGIDTLDALQALAKRQYRKICRYLHPDTSVRWKRHAPRARPKGQNFQTATEAYEWVMSLTERDVVRMERQSKQRYIRVGTGYSGRFRGSVSLLGRGEYDCPLPWHFFKERDYGYGFHEDLDYILYQ